MKEKTSKEKEEKIRQKPLRILYNNAVMVLKVLRMSPGYIFGMAAEGLVYGAINASESVFLFYLLNAMDKSPEFTDILGMIGIIAAFYLVARIYTSLYWHKIQGIVAQKLEHRLHRELYEKTLEMDLACYDDPVYYNDFVWAMDNAQGRAQAVIEEIGKIISRAVSSGAIFALLLTIDPIIAAVVCLSCLLDLILSHVSNKLGFKQQKEIVPLNRKRDYVNRIYYLSDYAKEMRLSDVNSSLMDAYHESVAGQVEVEKRYGKKQFFIWGLISNLLDNSTYLFVLLFSVWGLSRGMVEVGGLAAAVSAVWRFQWVLEDLLRRLAKFPEHSLYIDKYLTFLSYKPKVVSGEGKAGDFESLALENVSFAYPITQASHPKGAPTETEKSRERDKKGEEIKASIRNVTLTVKKGEKVAFVGYNGAGKTTLTKLMMRLYDPTEGRILYNGRDLRELKLEEYRERIGAVFQDYRLFGASIAENVLGGAYHHTEEEEARVRKALHDATFDDRLAEMEKGLDTILTKEFDDGGVNLSGGEGQKIAIARLFARDCDVMIMDEPSSALDPLAEYELNQAILRRAKDKAVIFISHRLSTTRMADRIYMFENGSVIESGSHEELMELDGKYAEMFRMQAEKYRMV